MPSHEIPIHCNVAYTTTAVCAHLWFLLAGKLEMVALHRDDSLTQVIPAAASNLLRDYLLLEL